MNFVPKINRRSFVVGAAAVGGGLSIGLELPTGPQVVRAADGSPEIGVWVVIRPDETVVIRTARSEMGQGSVTGLAQLIAHYDDPDHGYASRTAPQFVRLYASDYDHVARVFEWSTSGEGGEE